ncbi:Por secretion system C-terminal sorting domain-containing protein [Marivirga sericea]|uniref:Por secretion system C-terminal sorting domain-containing protein n=1 Tax=Marivirga sericea TaxID=1028 RepID=A0A1X7L0R4_9BACT|nr:S8 family serine peptidase [Marivirga sericea]SMG47411.1 Por secretion system C-terminal sorting domain-containing protein [Marivirga sericea]
MKKTITTLFALSFLVSLTMAQEFNPQKLHEIAAIEKTQLAERQERIEKFLENSDRKRTIQLEDGNTGVLVDVLNGHPQYMATHNLQARYTTGVEFVQAESGLNLPLYGSNMTIGVWDGGLVLNSHQEFGGRIKNKLGSEYSNHATHVTGTIAAAGVNPDAKGMLPEVTIHSYFAFEDDLGPMAEEASNGLILSNHSYGLVLGWRFNGNAWEWFGQDNGKDNRFGSYTSDSRTLDNIAYNAPYYTIVWSAGNDRSDAGDGTRPPDGPFNIVGPAATSKNIITVGAITGYEEYEGPISAEISSFSSWGPTNDGRIKPDIVGDGVGVFSASSSGDDQYATLQGTSMSAPNVTGSLGVLQEFYRQSADTFMTAAQLKSLAIHTAREAGQFPGPDYKFGWGVMNAVDAIKVMQSRNDKDTLMTSATLNEGEVHEYEIIPDTKTKLTATIAWTDVPGQVTELGSPTPHLVNDLDIHLEDDAGNIYYPWRMNPDNVGGAASKGVNSLDNVEKVEFVAPNVRKYRLVVSHKGSLESGAQTYALSLTYGSAKVSNDLVYWVGGNGDFTSGTNFSQTSGGASQAIDLAAVKSLTVDENSFANDGVITMTSDLELDNIIFTSDKVLTIDLAGNTLTINNAIHSAGENLKISNGKLVVKSDPNNNVYLEFDGSDNLAIDLDNDGQFIIESSVKADQLNIINGNYTIQNKRIAVEGLNLFKEAKASLENNVIELSGLFYNYSDSVSFKGNSWSLNDAIVSSDYRLAAGDTIQASGSNSFTGQFHFAKLINNSEIEVIDKFEVDSLQLSSGSKIVINNEDSLLVHNGLKLLGNDVKQISGSNSDALANLEFTFRSKLCLDNLVVENIHFSSQSVLNVTSNGSITNSVNVLELPCEDLIFPDFQISSTCANGLIYLDNLSDGEIDDFSWDFGNGMIFEGVNDVMEPVIWFDSIGEYEIKLIVSNENQTSEFSKFIQVDENTLNEIKIVENDQGLVATVSGAEYQWFKDGVAIEGETERVLSIDFESGVYNVAYFGNAEEGCESRVSDSFEYIVTSNDKELVESIILFPNPVNNILTVKNFENYEKIRIFEFQGKIVHSEDLNQTSNSIRLDVSNYKSGLYFIELSGKNKSIKLKFLIE